MSSDEQSLRDLLPHGRSASILRRFAQTVRLNMKDIRTDFMRKATYDSDNDGLIDYEAGGLEQDLSAAAKGSILAANEVGVFSLVTGTSAGDVAAVQSDGTIAWEALSGASIVVTDTGNVVVTDDGHIVVRT